MNMCKDIASRPRHLSDLCALKNLRGRTPLTRWDDFDFLFFGVDHLFHSRLFTCLSVYPSSEGSAAEGNGVREMRNLSALCIEFLDLTYPNFFLARKALLTYSQRAVEGRKIRWSRNPRVLAVS